jgi:hypothetical protein
MSPEFQVSRHTTVYPKRRQFMGEKDIQKQLKEIYSKKDNILDRLARDKNKK